MESYNLKFENGRSCTIECDNKKSFQDKINECEVRYDSECVAINGKPIKKHSLGGFLVGATIGAMLGNSVPAHTVSKTTKGVKRTTKKVTRSVKSHIKKFSGGGSVDAELKKLSEDDLKKGYRYPLIPNEQGIHTGRIQYGKNLGGTYVFEIWFGGRNKIPHTDFEEFKKALAPYLVNWNWTIGEKEKKAINYPKFDKGGSVEAEDIDKDAFEYLKTTYPDNTDEKLGDIDDDEYNDIFFEMVDDLRERFNLGEDNDNYANSLVEEYMSSGQFKKGGKAGYYKLNELLDLRDSGVKTVVLNGFSESINYVIDLNLDDSEIKKVSKGVYETKYKQGGKTPIKNQDISGGVSKKPRWWDKQVRPYEFFVFNTETNKVWAGNEYQQDAKDELKEFLFDAPLLPLKVLTKRAITNKKINPLAYENWARSVEIFEAIKAKFKKGGKAGSESHPIGSFEYRVYWLEDGIINSEYFKKNELNIANELYDQLAETLFYYQPKKIVIDRISDGEIIRGKEFEYADGGMSSMAIAGASPQLAIANEVSNKLPETTSAIDRKLASRLDPNRPKWYEDRGMKYANGGMVGQDIVFDRWGEHKTGTITEVLSNGSFAVSSGMGSYLVEPENVISLSQPKEKRNGWFFAKGGSTPYNYSWHFDHDRHNKSEEYEVPTSKRKKFSGGGSLNEQYEWIGETKINGRWKEVFKKGNNFYTKDWLPKPHYEYLTDMSGIKNFSVFKLGEIVKFSDGGKTKEQRYIILSPDGFSISMDETYTESEIIPAFNKWKKQYEKQGYYSTWNHQRIALSDLKDMCSVIEVEE